MENDDMVFGNANDGPESGSSSARLPQRSGNMEGMGNNDSGSRQAGSSNRRDREPEINSDEYERIRIMLGAGQHGDQPRLSDIFLNRENTPTLQDTMSKDPYNAMRYLN